jgi:hypothetical protein
VTLQSTGFLSSYCGMGILTGRIDTDHVQLRTVFKKDRAMLLAGNLIQKLIVLDRGEADWDRYKVPRVSRSNQCQNSVELV